MYIKNIKGFIDSRGILIFTSPKILDFDYKYLTIGTINLGDKRGGHYHKRIKEKLLVISGIGKFTLDSDSIILYEGDIVDIPVNSIHIIQNIGKEVLTFIEYKSEEFNEEDKDIYNK